MVKKQIEGYLREFSSICEGLKKVSRNYKEDSYVVNIINNSLQIFDALKGALDGQQQLKYSLCEITHLFINFTNKSAILER